MGCCTGAGLARLAAMAACICVSSLGSRSEVGSVSVVKADVSMTIRLLRLFTSKTVTRMPL